MTQFCKITKTCSICNIQKTLLSSSWYSNNECAACRAKKRYPNSGRKLYKDKWREVNKEHCSKQLSKYRKQRNKTDIQFKLRNALRKRFSLAIKNNHKTGSVIKNLGCSITDLKQHLESLWQPGMSWDNYGVKGWHIDHVTPLASFDLADPEQLKKACHYTNLQPLWWQDNLSKGDK